MNENIYIKLTPDSEISGNYLINKRNNVKLKISGTEIDRIFNDIREFKLTLNELEDKYGKDNIKLLIDNNFIYPSKFTKRFFKSLFEHSLTTFFSLPATEYDKNIYKDNNVIGLFGISSFSSSMGNAIEINSVNALREASSKLLNFRINRNSKIEGVVGDNYKKLNGKTIFDFGNIKYSINQQDMIDILKSLGSLILNGSRIKPIFIGGDHAVTFYLLQERLKKRENVQIIQFDAHKDTGYTRFSLTEHGSFIRDIIKSDYIKRVIQIGIRGPRDYKEYSGISEKVYEANINNVNDLLIPDVPIYISIDLDVFDPSIIPAVEYPISGGLKISDFQKLLKQIKRKKSFIGADMVEYNKKYDFQNLLGATTASQTLLILLENL